MLFGKLRLTGWAGVLLRNNAECNIENSSIIKNSYQAIAANNNSTFESDNSRFENNVTGITGNSNSQIDFNFSTIINSSNAVIFNSRNIFTADHSIFENTSIALEGNGNASTSDGTFNILNSNFIDCETISEIGSCDIYTFMENTTSDCTNGINIEKCDMATISSNSIITTNTSIQCGQGSYIIDNNPMIKCNGGAFNFGASAIRLSGSQADINNNIIERSGLGSAIYSEAAMESLKVNNNDIVGGGLLGFYQVPAVYHGGTPADSETNLNVITANSSAGIHNINSSDMDIECNDINTSGSYFSRAIFIETGSDRPKITGNTLSGYRDLYINSSSIEERDHLGNCYNGEAVEAVGFSDIELQTTMQFLVNPFPNLGGKLCYRPAEVLPIDDWFDSQTGAAQSCDGQEAGVGGSPFIQDEDKICAFLSFLDESLQDPTRRQLGIIRLISLFKTIYGADYYQENTIPKCLQSYLDTTSLCGIQMIIDTENMVEDAILGSDTIRLQIQLQATISFLSLQQWQDYDIDTDGNSQAEKDQLWQNYITELDILKALIQTKRTEEEMIWTAIDSIAIEECLDSISMISIKAYKYMTHMDELSESEKVDIVKYAKKCASQYGHGVHLMRSIASKFDNTDYREYDVNCEESEQEGYKNQELEYRKSNAKLHIIPNPNDGTFVLNTKNDSGIDRITIQDLQGRVVFYSDSIDQGHKMHIDINAGLYLINVEFHDGDLITEKMIISK